YLAAGTEFVDGVIDEIEHLRHEVAERHLDLLSEIDQFAFDAPAAGPPLVLEDQGAPVHAKSQILLAKFPELEANRLDQRRERQRFFQAHHGVANAELDRFEEGMRPHVPPNLLAVVDGVGLDEDSDILVKLRRRLKGLGNVRARKALENLCPVAFQSGLPSEPERGVRRERQQVRQKVTRLVHDLERQHAIADADVNVQAENQVGTRQELQLLD